MDEDLFLSDQHPGSRRWAIVEDDGRSCWLYLTEADSTRIVAHCWLYNRVPAPSGRIFERGDTPIVPAEYVIDPAPFPAPAATSVGFRWTQDGQGVAVQLAGELMGYLALPARFGYSRNLKAPGPYGCPLDLDAYAQAFEHG
jgi:hypothetical protein